MYTAIAPPTIQTIDPIGATIALARMTTPAATPTQPVRSVVDVKPDVGVLLPWSDEPPHAIGKHLGAAACQRTEPRRLELAQHLLV